MRPAVSPKQLRAMLAEPDPITKRDTLWIIWKPSRAGSSLPLCVLVRDLCRR
jgi:hypothetical protein